jgi:hypothetical protein
MFHFIEVGFYLHGAVSELIHTALCGIDGLGDGILHGAELAGYFLYAGETASEFL